MAKGERFHPDSPIQPDRRSPVPFVISSLLLAAVAWQARDSWVDSLAPPYAEKLVQRAPAAHHTQGTKAESAKGNLVSLFSADDYPVEALRNNEEGTVTVRLEIDPKGRVGDCTLVQSSGFRSLDETTCKILSDRAHFTPARNSDGQSVPDTYTQKVVWQLAG